MNQRNLLYVLLACSGVCCESESSLFTHSLAWQCITSSGCERADAVTGIDRAWVGTNQIDLYSSTDVGISNQLTRVPSPDAPEGCKFLYGLNLFGHSLEPLVICRAGDGDGFDFDVEIPNSNPTSASAWHVEIRRR
ncbi:hypothetical protein Hoch_4897 [Haliangium ochraceum DSM 14365]|uniref:Uncharacterized protein n=1 Tax=Haliangium ochraceum (strain DSM 14365 / JCM 11303 / SMP-2) TaxID=502025 RepID=D0LU22_HALO1|nr:hypothetical protein Hoch_4897 [Haliangium ochraceum DSM 14365]